MVGALFMSMSSPKVCMIASLGRLAKRSNAGSDVGDHAWGKQGSQALQNLAAQKGEVVGNGRARNPHIEGAVAQGIRPRVFAQEISSDISIGQEDALLSPAPASSDLANHGGNQRRGGLGLALASAWTGREGHGGNVYLGVF
jgi:hypothetical protein